jgi:sugar lactone lactonase YvrE
LACAASQGFALLEGNSALTYICQPLPKAHLPHIRFNDGACDSKGRFFAGTIYSKDKGIPGQLWRYDPADGSCVVVDEGPFTVCCSVPHPLRDRSSRTCRTLTAWVGARTRRHCELFALVRITYCAYTYSRYFTDSKTNIIYAYDYDDGKISNRRVFTDAREQGLPDQTFADGLCIDSEGCVWSARSFTSVLNHDEYL